MICRTDNAPALTAAECNSAAAAIMLDPRTLAGLRGAAAIVLGEIGASAADTATARTRIAREGRRYL